jgi:hypothetical protein
VHLGGLSGFGLRMVQEDLHRQIIDNLVTHQPDIVVLDLVDERLPLARLGRSWITGSDYLKSTGQWDRMLAEADEVSALTQSKRRTLFAAAARRLVKRLVRDLPKTTFVLNEAPFTTEVADGTTLPEPQAGWARDLDAAQRPLMDVLAAQFGSRLLRATPPPQVCLVDPDHRWGLASYHYIEAYYHWLIDVLLTVEPPASAATRAGRGVIDLSALERPTSFLRSLLNR